MKAEIICVGTELLLGDIVNTNARYLSRQLAKLGIDMYYQSVVGDNGARLLEALKQALSRSELILFIGGLGPTKDCLLYTSTPPTTTTPALRWTPTACSWGSRPPAATPSTFCGARRRRLPQ